MGKKPTDPFKVHQLRIAKATLKMPDPILGVMGGMTKAQAKAILKPKKAAKPKDLWEVSLTDTISTAHNFRNKEGKPVPLSMIVQRDVMIGSTAGEVMRKFSKQVAKEGKYNLAETRDARYGRFVIGAAPRRANPHLDIWDKYPQLKKQVGLS